MAELEKFCREHPDAAKALASELLRLAAQDDTLAAPPRPTVDVSLVFPVYNEEENIPELYRQVTAVLDDSDVSSAELLFINNGCHDGSEALIRALREKDPRVKMISFSRNFGHQGALTAGIDYSVGRAVILMDADLQDPPAVIVDMLREWRAGAEIVYAVRRTRDDDTFYKRNVSKSFYRLLQYVSDINIPLDSGDFCLLDRRVVDRLKELPEKNRFLRGLRSWLGFRQVAVSFDRPARHAGEAKYGVAESIQLAINGIVGFSSLPLRMAVYAGLLALFASIVLAIYALGAYFREVQIERGWTSLVIIVLFIGSIQLILLGSIGEYIGRIYDEAKQRPNYIVTEFLD